MRVPHNQIAQYYNEFAVPQIPQTSVQIEEIFDSPMETSPIATPALSAPVDLANQIEQAVEIYNEEFAKLTVSDLDPEFLPELTVEPNDFEAPKTPEPEAATSDLEWDDEPYINDPFASFPSWESFPTDNKLPTSYITEEELATVEKTPGVHHFMDSVTTQDPTTSAPITIWSHREITSYPDFVKLVVRQQTLKTIPYEQTKAFVLSQEHFPMSCQINNWTAAETYHEGSCYLAAFCEDAQQAFLLYSTESAPQFIVTDFYSRQESKNTSTEYCCYLKCKPAPMMVFGPLDCGCYNWCKCDCETVIRAKKLTPKKLISALSNIVTIMEEEEDQIEPGDIVHQSAQERYPDMPSAKEIQDAQLRVEGIADHAVCSECNLTLGHWQKGDDPLKDHRKWANDKCLGARLRDNKHIKKVAKDTRQPLNTQVVRIGHERRNLATFQNHLARIYARKRCRARQVAIEQLKKRIATFKQQKKVTEDWNIHTETYYTQTGLKSRQFSSPLRKLTFTPNAKTTQVFWSRDEWKTFAKLIVETESKVSEQMQEMGYPPVIRTEACSGDNNFIMEQCKSIIKKVTGITDKLICVAVGLVLASAVTSVIAAVKAENRTARWSSIASAVCSLVSVACLIVANSRLKKNATEAMDSIKNLVGKCTSTLHSAFSAKKPEEVVETPKEKLHFQYVDDFDNAKDKIWYVNQMDDMHWYSLQYYGETAPYVLNALAVLPSKEPTRLKHRKSWSWTEPPKYNQEEWTSYIVSLAEDAAPQAPSSVYSEEYGSEEDAEESILVRGATFLQTKNRLVTAPLSKDVEQKPGEVDEAQAIEKLSNTIASETYKAKAEAGLTHICTKKCWDKPGKGKVDWYPYTNILGLVAHLYVKSPPETPIREEKDLKHMGFRVTTVSEMSPRDTNCPNCILLCHSKDGSYVGLPTAYTAKKLQYGLNPPHFWPEYTSITAGHMTGTKLFDKNAISYIPYSVDMIPQLRNGEMHNDRCKRTYGTDSHTDEERGIYWNTKIGENAAVKHHTAEGRARFTAYPIKEAKNLRPLTKRTDAFADFDCGFIETEHGMVDVLPEEVKFSDSSSMIKLCTGVIATLGVGSYLGMSEKMDPIKACQLINQASTAKTNLDGAMNWIADVLLTSSEDESLSDIYKKIQRRYQILNAIPATYINVKPEFVYAIKRIQNEIVDFVKLMKNQKNSSEVSFYVRQCNLMTQELNRKFAEVVDGRENSGSRVPVLFVQLCGGKGLGKSTAVQAGGAIIRDINLMLGLDPETAPHQIIVDGGGFYNAYGGQAVGIRDEFLRQGDKDPFIEQVNALASPAAHGLSGAFVKQQPVAYRIVFLISNVMHVTIRDYVPEVRDAFWSRILRYRVSHEGIEKLVDDWGRHVVTDRDPRKWKWQRFTCNGDGEDRNETTIDYENFLHDVHRDILKLEYVNGSYRPLTELSRVIKEEVHTQMVNVQELTPNFKTRKFSQGRADDMPQDMRKKVTPNIAMSGHAHCVIHVHGKPGMGKTTFVKRQLANRWHTIDRDAKVYEMTSEFKIPADAKERDVYIVEDLLLAHQDAYHTFYQNLPGASVIIITSNIEVERPNWIYDALLSKIGTKRTYLNEIKAPGLLRRVGFSGQICNAEHSVDVVGTANFALEMTSRLNFKTQSGEDLSPIAAVARITQQVAQWADVFLEHPLKQVVDAIDENFNYDVVITAKNLDHLKNVLSSNTAILANLGMTPDHAIYLNPDVKDEFIESGNFSCAPWVLKEGHNRDEIAATLYSTLRQFRPQSTVKVVVGDYQAAVKSPGVMEVLLSANDYDVKFLKQDVKDTVVHFVSIKSANEEILLDMQKVETGILKGWTYVDLSAKEYEVVVANQRAIESIPEVSDIVLAKQAEREKQQKQAAKKAKMLYLKSIVYDHPILFSLACIALIGFMCSTITKAVKAVAGWWSSSSTELYKESGELIEAPLHGLACQKCKTKLVPEVRTVYLAQGPRQRLCSVMCSKCKTYVDLSPGMAKHVKAGMKIDNEIIHDQDLEWLRQKTNDRTQACGTISESTTEKRPKNMIYFPSGQVVSTDAPQWSDSLFACGDDNIDVVKNKIRQNFVKVSCCGSEVYGIGLAGKLVVTVAHIFFKNKAKPQVAYLEDGVERWVPATLVRQYTDRDIAFVTVDDKTKPQFKNIIRYVSTGADLDYVHDVALAHYKPNNSSDMYYTTAVFGDRIDLPIAELNVSDRGVMTATTLVALTTMKAIGRFAKKGRCGHPLLAFPNKDIQCRILCGLFNSSSKDAIDVTCSLLTREVVEDVIKHMHGKAQEHQLMGVLMPNKDAVYFTDYEVALFSKMYDNPCNDQVVSDNLTYIGSIPHGRNERVKLEPTIYHDIVAEARPLDVGIVPKVAPDVPEVVKDKKGKPCYYSTELSKIKSNDKQDDKIKKAVNEFVLKLYEDVYGTYYTLNTFKVLNGCENVSKARKSTAVGPSVKVVHPKADRKGYFYEERGQTTHWKETEEAQRMLEREMQILNLWYQGKPVLFVTEASIKEELLPKEKLAKGKARLFGAADQTCVNLEKRVMGGFIANAVETPANVVIGLDQQYDFHRMRRIFRTYPRVLNVDQKAFDKHTSNRDVKDALRIILNLNSTIEMRENRFQIIEAIAESLSKYIFVANGQCYHVTSGLNSGQYCTNIGGSTVSIVRGYYGVAKALMDEQQLDLEKAMLVLRRYFVMACGDDIVIMSNALQLPSAELVVHYMQDSGVTMQSPSKTGVNNYEWTMYPDTPIEFCGRNITEVEGYVVAPIRETAIYKGLYYTRDASRQNAILQLRVALEELYLHGDEKEYNKKRQLFQQCQKKTGIREHLPTWNEARLHFLEKHHGKGQVPLTAANSKETQDLLATRDLMIRRFMQNTYTRVACSGDNHQTAHQDNSEMERVDKKSETPKKEYMETPAARSAPRAQRTIQDAVQERAAQKHPELWTNKGPGIYHYEGPSVFLHDVSAGSFANSNFSPEPADYDVSDTGFTARLSQLAATGKKCDFYTQQLLKTILGTKTDKLWNLCLKAGVGLVATPVTPEPHEDELSAYHLRWQLVTASHTKFVFDGESWGTTSGDALRSAFTAILGAIIVDNHVSMKNRGNRTFREWFQRIACAGDNERTGGRDVSDSSAVPNSSDTFVSTNLQQDAGTFSLQGGMIPMDILKGGMHKNILDTIDQDFLIATKTISQTTAAGDNLLTLHLRDALYNHPFAKMMMQYSTKVSGYITFSIISTMSQLNQGGIIGYMVYPEGNSSGDLQVSGLIEKQLYQHDIRAVTQGISTRFTLPLCSQSAFFFWTEDFSETSDPELQPKFNVDAITAISNATTAAGDTAGLIYVHVNVSGLVFAGIKQTVLPPVGGTTLGTSTALTNHKDAINVNDVVGGIATLCLTGRSEMRENISSTDLYREYDEPRAANAVPAGLTPVSWGQVKYNSAPPLQNCIQKSTEVKLWNIADAEANEEIKMVVGRICTNKGSYDSGEVNPMLIASGTRTSKSKGSFTYLLRGGDGAMEILREDALSGLGPFYHGESSGSITEKYEARSLQWEWETPLVTVGQTYNIGEALPETWTNVTLRETCYHINTLGATNTNVGDDGQYKLFNYIKRKYDPTPGSIWAFSFLNKRYNQPVAQCVLYAAANLKDWRMYARVEETECVSTYEDSLIMSNPTQQSTSYVPPMTTTRNWVKSTYSSDTLSAKFMVREQVEKLGRIHSSKLDRVVRAQKVKSSVEKTLLREGEESPVVKKPPRKEKRSGRQLEACSGKSTHCPHDRLQIDCRDCGASSCAQCGRRLSRCTCRTVLKNRRLEACCLEWQEGCPHDYVTVDCTTCGASSCSQCGKRFSRCTCKRRCRELYACSLLGGAMSGMGNALNQRKQHKYDMENQDNWFRNAGNLSQQNFEQQQQLNMANYQNQKQLEMMRQSGSTTRADIAADATRYSARQSAGANVESTELQQQGANQRLASSQNFTREMKGIGQSNIMPSGTSSPKPPTGGASGEGSTGAVPKITRAAEDAAVVL
ncbi:hypothetical protein [Beihai blue swimmer crab virus 1]|uniref:hypothetical protein n=1 Tax=Beihai blue swimmer crab virus 1 TaxID=1922368 RepID=UPI000909CDBA|nr:hypothetical protein [Beihai blue swimmer crab virus 1]APG78597.1 hypothetical protein [Beihai blue swimmer crab virus 1]